jgi:DNA-binding transcriptional ArsR family regulator
MDTLEAITALSALAQPTRLDAFRRLAAREPDGALSGDVARAAGVPQNTMSTHLSVMARAGLVTAERRGRAVIYRADLARFRDLTRYLLHDCCGGQPELCAAIIDDLAPCCPKEEAGA